MTTSNFNKRILVACEYTGSFTNALLEKGFDVVSCDLLDSEGSKSHIKGDVMDLIESETWFALFGFPPCDFLSLAGLHYCNIEKHGLKAAERIKKRDLAVQFFLKLWLSDIKYIMLENPKGFISSTILKPTQIVSPHYFGDNYRKDTCLWLKGFPPITYELQNTLFSEKSSFDLVTEKHPSGANKIWTDNKSKKQRSVMSKIMAREIVDQFAKILSCAQGN